MVGLCYSSLPSSNFAILRAIAAENAVDEESLHRISIRDSTGGVPYPCWQLNKQSTEEAQLLPRFQAIDVAAVSGGQGDGLAKVHPDHITHGGRKQPYATPLCTTIVEGRGTMPHGFERRIIVH